MSRAFQLPVPQSGTLSRISSGTQPSVRTVSDGWLKRICSLDTSAFSVLEVLTTTALYKFTYLLIYYCDTIKFDENMKGDDKLLIIPKQRSTFVCFANLLVSFGRSRCNATYGYCHMPSVSVAPG